MLRNSANLADQTIGLLIIPSVENRRYSSAPRFSRRLFLLRLQKRSVWLFVFLCSFLYFLCSLECHEVTTRSEKKWKNAQKVCLLAKILSALVVAARLQLNREFIVFDDAANSARLHTFLFEQNMIRYVRNFDRLHYKHDFCSFHEDSWFYIFGIFFENFFILISLFTEIPECSYKQG